MSNLELIDEYLTNRLSGKEKEAFEKQLSVDPSLKSELALQKVVIEGIKSARVAQLKEMLNNVPVSPASTFGATAGKIAVGAVAAGAIAVAVYLYTHKSEETKPAPVSNIVTVAPSETPKVAPETKELKKSEESAKKGIKTEPATVRKKTAPSEKAKPKEEVVSVKPAIAVPDPSDEMATDVSASTPKQESGKSLISTSRIAVETDATNKKYSFHYQFNQGKLMLFGKFDKGLYEILEINGDSHSVFLFYKDNYYLLDERQTKVTALETIKDTNLVRKLKEFRNQ